MSRIYILIDPQKGKPLSEEHKAKLRAALKGRPKSPEHRAKLTAANQARAAREALEKF